MRLESGAAIRQQRGQGLKVIMLTEDTKAVASLVAANLGLDAVFADVRPEDKVLNLKTKES